MSSILDKIPVLPKKLSILLIEDDILLPGIVKTIPINNARHKNLVNTKFKNTKKPNTLLGVIPSLRKGTIGTAALLHKVTGTSVIVSGLARFQINKVITEDPFVVAEVIQIDKHLDCEEANQEPEIIALVDEIQNIVLTMFDDVTLTSILKTSLKKIPPCLLPEICTYLITLNFADQLTLLKTIDVKDRLKLILTHLKRAKEGVVLKTKTIIIRSPNLINSERNRANSAEVSELEKSLKSASLPENVRKIADRDLQILKRTVSMNPEYSILFNYLTLLAELPWDKFTKETLDLYKAKNDLEVDHHGLEQVKKRILEYLAVRKLLPDTSSNKNPILCLVGPPGVGKTSIARSVAATLNRPFIRVSLGGISHMADIRGHRRTYVAAMPGRIIQAVKRSGVKNPVILLDEIDKMTSGLHGNPAAALLEVLDPAQNKEFVDHYLNVPFDLSEIMFIATANTVRNLAPALHDRLEIIKLSGYTYLEKIEIAKAHLLPKQLKENGLEFEKIEIPDGTLQLIINNYTREAGVRDLERKIGALCRDLAVRITMNKEKDLRYVIDINTAQDILGPLLFENNKWTSRLGRPGVAVGLVVTLAGGDTVAVECCHMPGSGKLILTGNLGNVMKESAQLAWGWIKGNSSMYGIEMDGTRLSRMDVHIHFPEGAVSKDGPSAGVTIATALMSLFLDRPLLPSVAMTGEITLQGLVLPVGGIKEKVIAAHKDGFTKIILPKENAKNLHDVPIHIKDELTFVMVSDMHSVMEAAFEGGMNLLLPQQYLKSKL